MKKYIISLILVLSLTFGVGAVSAFAETVVLSNQSLTVDGKEVSCEAYNIDGYNYFKLRDMAMLLNGTGSSFDVGWDSVNESVLIISGEKYTPVGGEVVFSGDKSSTAVKSTQKIYLNESPVENLSVYNIGGNNYFKLRDLGEVIGFTVDYDSVSDRIVVKSKEVLLQSRDLVTLTLEQKLELLGPIFTEDMKQSGILASVSMAQFILESSYGVSELAINANNCFGMKTDLSGNTWPGSTWDGVSVYTKYTKEEYEGNIIETIVADFRKYDSIRDSIADHSAYLNGAMNGDKLRYAGLKGCRDYRTAAQIIKDGGYATSLTYVEKLCGLIERYDLTKYDVV